MQQFGSTTLHKSRGALLPMPHVTLSVVACLFHLPTAAIAIMPVKDSSASGGADFSWPQARIPYIDDLNLLADVDQAVALNNARMDLQVRTCIKFIPRRAETDYVFFTDLGPQVECWNLFTDKPSGKVPVNVGPSCLEPMRRPHRPKRVFSECDTEYVNRVFNCPRYRRKISPVCPPEQNIFPQASLSTTTTIPPPHENATTDNGPSRSKGGTNTAGAGSHQETSDGDAEHVQGEYNGNSAEGGGEEAENGDGIGEDGHLGEGAEETGGEEAKGHEGTEVGDAHAITHSGEIISVVDSNISSLSSTSPTSTASVNPSTSSMVVMASKMATETVVITTPTPPPPSATASITTPAAVNGPPMMVTLISTTTTTTIRPPKPGWVQSVEDAFDSRHGRREHNGGTNDGEREAVLGENGVNGRSGLPEDYEGEIEHIGGGESAQEGVEVKVIEGKKLPKKGKRPKPPANKEIDRPVESGELSGVEDEEGFTTISKTKVTTTIEKSKYIGPCGSACSYSGDLVKLYRSYNDKLEVNDHFYTTDRLEHQLMTAQGYVVQPHMGYVGKNQLDPKCMCLMPLYRLYNELMKDHLLTANEQERHMAEKILGYKFERLLGYCTKEPGCGAYLPLYRLYNAISKDHLYTVDQQEMRFYKQHPEQGYGFERIECYVWQHNSSTRECPAISLLTTESTEAGGHGAPEIVVAGTTSNIDEKLSTGGELLVRGGYVHGHKPTHLSTRGVANAVQPPSARRSRRIRSPCVAFTGHSRKFNV